MDRRRLLFLIATAVLLASLAGLHAFDGLGSTDEVSAFVCLVLVAGAAYMMAARFFDAVSPDRRKLLVWLVAIGARLIVLTIEPADDFWRYVWEGTVQWEGHNPYAEAPDAPGLASFRDSDWEKIHHKDWAAIYPPIAELSFRAISRVSLNPLFWKAVFAFADLSVIWILSRLLTGAGRWRTVIWYAWNPALILAFAGHGHFDALLLMFFSLATWALYRADPLGTGEPSFTWSLASVVFLGVAIGLKTVPLFALPLWLFALKRRWPLGFLALVPVLLASLPFGGPMEVGRSVASFANVARFDDLAWWAVEQSVWPNPGGRNLRYIVLAIAVVLAITWVMRNDWRRGLLWIIGALLLLSPVVHPWYITWVLPFACWRKARAWYVLAITAACGLLASQDGVLWQAWEPSPWLRAAVWLPPLLAWILTSREQTETKQGLPA